MISRRGFACVCLCASVACAQSPRVTVNLDHGWRFLQSAAISGAESATFDDAAWQAIDVPHTWNRLGNEGTTRSPLTNTVQGVGWYRLRFSAPPPGGRYFLQFDAVGAIAAIAFRPSRGKALVSSLAVTPARGGGTS